MSFFVRPSVLLALFVAGCSLGCDDGTFVSEEQQGEVRTKEQLALVGEACTTAADCTDLCHTALDCVGNVCVGTPIVCSDGNPCTDDACADPTIGCESVNDNNNTCSDDGDVCTQDHFCLNGSCEGNNPITCDDGEDCTDDFCDATLGCQATNDDSNTCSDGAACTENDACNAGTCSGTAKICDTDPDDCVSGTCNPSNGNCQNQNVASSTACDDNNPCTLNTSCGGGGVCNQVGGTLDCNDSNLCTTDSCNAAAPDAATACVNTVTPCAGDGNACTSDACNPATGCTYPTITCDDADACTSNSCNTSTGCVFADISATCNDSQVCTTDSCNPATGCVNAPLPDAQACNDGNACNDGETCQGGVCQGGSARNCNDNNQCTADGCNTSTGCTNTNRPSGFTCNDGIACTEQDQCNGSGVCHPLVTNHTSCNSQDTECSNALCERVNGCVRYPDEKLDVVCRPSVGVCDVTEVCDGLSETCPADGFSSALTQCVAASCTGGQQTDQLLCSGNSNACGTPTVTDCVGFACDGGSPSVCLTTCTDNSDCLGTHYCDSTTSQCQPRQSAGGACTADDQCNEAQGDSCVDGRCCNSPCSGQCEACDVPGSLGTCVAVPADQAPHPGGPTGAQRPDCASDGSSCGGTCDGTNRAVCAFPAVGTECAAADCNPGTNQAVEASVCNGLGACNAPAAVSCDPFVCQGDTCRVTCSQDSHCDGNLQCIAGTCVDAFTNGSDCTVGSQCASGLCVDGVCCDSACTGQCEACNVSGNLGTCSPVEGDPVGGRPACSGSGDCAGTCGGTVRTACTFPGSQVTCRDAACVDGTATLATSCNGGGICPGAQTVTCPDGCDGLICMNPECTINPDCPEGEVCRAGMCVPPDEDGVACSSGTDCASGFCVDGVCCDAACSGQCEACDVPSNVGTCSPAPVDTQPRGGRQPCTTDGSVCGGACDGTTRDACEYPTTGDCRDPSCDSGVAILSATCDGSGACPLLQEQDCGADSCDAAGEVCDGPCAADPTACAADEYCSAGVCVALRDPGMTCATNDQCDSGFCVDGVCCNSECAEQCGACNVPGSEGVCSPVSGEPVGGRPGCEGSGLCGATCDGQDVRACAFPGNELRCSAESCSSGVEQQAGRCSGNGTCLPGDAVACPTLLCNGNECATSCETDDDCHGELICVDGACISDPLIDAVDKGSCGCRVPGKGAPGGGLPLILLAPLALLAWRRRVSKVEDRTGS